MTLGVSFSQDETAQILAHGDGDHYSAALAAKIAEAGMSEYADVMPRNLGVLIGALRQRPAGERQGDE